MLEDLNKHSVFDFEYAPVEGDTLEVTMDGRELSFKYENGKFVEGEEDYSFTTYGRALRKAALMFGLKVKVKFY